MPIWVDGGSLRTMRVKVVMAIALMVAACTSESGR